MPVLVVPENRAVDRVRASLSDNVELPARKLAEFCIEIILDDGEFLHRVLDDDTLRPSFNRVVVIYTIQDKAVVTGTVSSYRCNRASDRTADFLQNLSTVQPCCI